MSNLCVLIHGQRLISIRSVYAIVTAAQESMVRTWAYALGDNPELPLMKGTTANSVVVGPTSTDAYLSMDPSLQSCIRDAYANPQCVNKGGIASPEDVADVVGLLCSKDSRLVTGSAVSACGGAAFIL